MLLALPACHTISTMPCNSEVTQKWRLSFLSASPEPIVPGNRLCVKFQMVPEAVLRHGAAVHVSHPSFGGAPLMVDLCKANGVHCPTAIGKNVSGSVCKDVPLSAMLLAGQTLKVALSAMDEASAPIGCVHATVEVAERIAADPDVEAAASPAHHRLRRALNEARSQPAATAALTIGTLLRDAYDASPEWAAAFHAWRAAHGKNYHQADDMEEEADARRLLAEASGFAAFRSNVLSAHHNERPVSLDERSDMDAEQRRTLSHFA